MKKAYLYRSVAYFFGVSILAFGITLVIRAEIGVGPWDALIVALSKLTGHSVGEWIIMMGIFLLILNAILLKNRPDLPALITVFFLGNLVDFWFKSTSIPFLPLSLQYALFLLGVITVAFGVAIYTQAHFAITPIDKLMFVISDTTGLSIKVSRFISEGVALALAFLFKGPVGVGTILFFILIGPLIQFFIASIHSLSKRSTTI